MSGVGTGATTRLTATDEQGRFEVRDLEAGRYRVQGWKLGYVKLTYGQRHPHENGKLVEVSAGSVVSDVDLVLPRAAVITVKVISDMGEPVPGATVRAFVARFVDGKRAMATVNQNNYVTATDDRGEVRLFGLARGEYYVSAQLGQVGPFGIRQADAQIFFPGTPSVEDAQPVRVVEGQEAFIALPLVATRRAVLRALVVSSGGAIATDANVQFLSVRPGGVTAFPLKVTTDGSFQAVDVPPGDYVVQVRRRDDAGAEEYANVPVTFRGEDINLSIVTRAPATIAGRIVFDAPMAPPEARSTDFKITPEFVGMSVAPGTVVLRDDWAFQIRGIVGKGTIGVVHSGEKWFLKSVLLDGQDIADTPVDFQEALQGREVEIQLTDKRTEVAGQVLDERNAPVSDFVVVAFAEDATLWGPRSRYIASARPDQTGRFAVRGLPPGNYLVTAVDFLEKGQERDFATLERLRRLSIRVTLTAGQVRQQQLRLTSLR